MSNDLTPFYAFPGAPELEAIMRFGAVKRWHMLETTKTQTLAEHCANVAALAYVIADATPNMYFGPSHYVAAAALFHDITEVFSGDIPTPTKRFGDVRSMTDDLERQLTPRCFKFDVSGAALRLIKICDLSDGIRFIRQFGIDFTARHAEDGLFDQITSLRTDAADTWPKAVHQVVFRMVDQYVYDKTGIKPT